MVLSSPTFSLVNCYELPNGNPFYHFDLYRIRDLQEAIAIGFEEYLESGYICLIEWPDKIEPLLEPPYWEIILEHRPQGARQITLIQHG
jgi:tRNA threonylcarbamoyladenosine biosynthesis protein TsaE